MITVARELLTYWKGELLRVVLDWFVSSTLILGRARATADESVAACESDLRTMRQRIRPAALCGRLAAKANANASARLGKTRPRGAV